MPQQQAFSDSAVGTSAPLSIGITDGTINVEAIAGWPDDTIGEITATINRGLPDEERILIESIAGTTLTLDPSVGRGYGTSMAQAHGPGATIEHTISGAFLQDLSQRAFAVTTRGDIPVVATTEGVVMSRIPIGTQSQVLTVLNTGLPGWANSDANVLTTTGDMPYASAPNVPARLGIGTVGQVLVSSGTVPTWGVDPAVGVETTRATGAEAAITTALTTALAAAVPLTTAGDLLYENATPASARLAIGASRTALRVASGLPAWAISELTATAQSAAYDAADRDLVLMTGAHATTLPAPTKGFMIGVCQVTTAAATLTAASGSLLAPGISAWVASTGGTGAPLAHAGAFTLWVADGTNWNLVAGAIDSGWVQFDSVLVNSWTTVSTHVYWRQIGNRVWCNGTITNGLTGGLSFAVDPSGAAAANPPVCVQSFGGIVLAASASGTPGSAFATVSPGTGGAAIDVNFATASAHVYLDSLTYLFD